MSERVSKYTITRKIIFNFAIIKFCLNRLVIFFSFPSTMSRPGVQRKCVRPVLWAQDATHRAACVEERVLFPRL